MITKKFIIHRCIGIFGEEHPFLGFHTLKECMFFLSRIPLIKKLPDTYATYNDSVFYRIEEVKVYCRTPRKARVMTLSDLN